jgi:transcriptional regulator with XRE-family HTH domain
LCAFKQTKIEKLRTQMNIGVKIYRLRKGKGLSQAELSAFLKVSKSAIRKWEENKSAPRGENLSKLCVFFNLTFEEFMSETYEKNNESIDSKKPSKKRVAANNKQHGGDAQQIKMISEKLIEQYELRLKEKDEMIEMLRGMLGK